MVISCPDKNDKLKYFLKEKCPKVQFQVLRCEYLLVFFVSLDSKLSVLAFKTVNWAKQDILKRKQTKLLIEKCIK